MFEQIDSFLEYLDLMLLDQEIRHFNSDFMLAMSLPSNSVLQESPMSTMQAFLCLLCTVQQAYGARQ